MEYVLVGGGLQNALITLALLANRPDTRLVLVEKEPSLGGNHTWCFHSADVPAVARPWLDPLVVRRWPRHEVRFPAHTRCIDEGYEALTSERLNEVVAARIESAPHAQRITAVAKTLTETEVTLDGGTRLTADAVIDARGPALSSSSTACGYQKFFGLELELESGAPPLHPLLMDATVEQLDGFRFVYLLPWERRRILVEDTYYSNDPSLDIAVIGQRIFDYARERGWQVRRVLRAESGVLPLPTRSTRRARGGSALAAGYAGGLFHPTTGYSLPVALRFALHVAALPARALLSAHEAWQAHHDRQFRFGVRLNRLLFEAFAPQHRKHVLERFYRLPSDTIRRFYSLETTSGDRARILCGRPPAGFSLPRLLAGGRPS